MKPIRKYKRWADLSASAAAASSVIGSTISCIEFISDRLWITAWVAAVLSDPRFPIQPLIHVKVVGLLESVPQVGYTTYRDRQPLTHLQAV